MKKATFLALGLTTLFAVNACKKKEETPAVEPSRFQLIRNTQTYNSTDNKSLLQFDQTSAPPATMQYIDSNHNIVFVSMYNWELSESGTHFIGQISYKRISNGYDHSYNQSDNEYIFFNISNFVAGTDKSPHYCKSMTLTNYALAPNPINLKAE